MPALRHRFASSLFFALRQRGAVLLLPEVVRREVELHLVEKYQAAVKRALSAIGEVRQIVGLAPDIAEVSEADLRRAFQDRLDELGDLLDEIAIDDDDYVAAGKMVLGRLPPNSRDSQQYKDSLLWRSVVRATESYTVILVTNDKAFRDSSGRLAPSLSAELSGPEDVLLVPQIEDLLEMWKSDGSLGEYADEVKEGFAEKVREELLGVLPAYTNLDIGEAEHFDIEAFLTETPDELALSAKFAFELMNPEVDLIEPLGVVSGSASATISTVEDDFLGVSLERASITMITPHGDINLGDVAFASVSLGGAYSPRRYALREQSPLK